MTLRRMKTYTGGQGYVYQYYFVGQRPALPADSASPATEYVFDVTSDRKTTFSVSVFMPADSLATWAGTHRRSLNDAEQYGAAKMRLFQGFDEIEDMMKDGRHLVVEANTLNQLLESLGVD